MSVWEKRSRALRTLKLSALALAVVVAGVGCTSHAVVAPQRMVGLEPLKTTESYHIVGPAIGTSTGGKLFWIIPIGVERKAACLVSVGQTVSFASRMSSGGRYYMDPVVSAAIYNAVESVEDADAMMSPRVSIETRNYWIYVARTAHVKGKAIRYGPPSK